MKIILRLFAVFFIFSCNTVNENSIIIDNPSGQDIIVMIQKKKYEIPAFGSERITIKRGTYNIVAYMNDSSFFHENIHINRDGILNPHKETYVLWTDVYVSKNKNYNRNKLNIKNLEINGNTYNNVDFTVYKNKKFIPKKWDFNWDEPWDDKLNFYFHDSQKRSKIYRLNDLEEIFGYGKTPDFTKYKIEELKKILNQIQSSN